MGNKHGKDIFVAKETFHPTEIAFDDFCLQTPSNPKMVAKLKIENALRIDLGDRLEMIKDGEIYCGANGSRLYQMRNIETNEIGLVLDDCVRRHGSPINKK